MDTKELITAVAVDQLSKSISKKLNISQSKAESAVDIAIPLLTSGLSKNAKDPKEAENIYTAILKDHDGTILSKIPSAVDDKNTLEDGIKILDHILGKKGSTASELIGDKLELDKDQINNILALAAPIVLGSIGKRQKEQKLGSDDIVKMLKEYSNSNAKTSSKKSDILSQILDQNDNGSIVDEIINTIVKLFK